MSGQIRATVIGATGTQGGSVVKALLQDKTYSVRALVRNRESASAQALSSSGVEIVHADIDDYESLEKGFAGSHVIFAVTNFFEPFFAHGPDQAIEIEVQQGERIIKAAKATPTLQHLIWSTLPNSRKISGGKFVVPHFEGKNRIDDLIKADAELYAKTTFLWVTFYASNFVLPLWKPFNVSSATRPNQYVQFSTTPADVPIKSIGDASTNVGIFARAILAQPEKTKGRFVLADVEDLTAGQYLQTWVKAQKKSAEFVQIPKKPFDALFTEIGREMDIMQDFWDLVREDSWTGEDGIVTKEDLGVTGLVSTFDAFAAMNDWN